MTGAFEAWLRDDLAAGVRAVLVTAAVDAHRRGYWICPNCRSVALTRQDALHLPPCPWSALDELDYLRGVVGL